MDEKHFLGGFIEMFFTEIPRGILGSKYSLKILRLRNLLESNYYLQLLTKSYMLLDLVILSNME